MTEIIQFGISTTAMKCPAEPYRNDLDQQVWLNLLSDVRQELCGDAVSVQKILYVENSFLIFWEVAGTQAFDTSAMSSGCSIIQKSWVVLIRATQDGAMLRMHCNHDIYLESHSPLV
jgi:hypothetical protein